jgi:Icc-related predicted phosphoesterase
MKAIPASRSAAAARFIVASSKCRFSGGADGMAKRFTRFARSRNFREGYPASVNTTVRIAAAGDVHAAEELRERLARVFAEGAEDADLVLLAGDLTTHGLPDQASVLADACSGLSIPVVAVLGNHDHHSGCAEAVRDALEAGGIVVLDRSHVVLELGELDIGIVGTKGFVGGFPGAEIPDFGEPALRQIYQETTEEVEALEVGLEAIAGCHKRLVLLHYAPITDTIVGEPEGIWAFLGSGRLAGPIGMHRPDLVLHGHAHHGAARGAIGTVPVHNVAVHVTGQDFATFVV